MENLTLTAEMVAHLTGGRLVSGSPDEVFDTVSTDSRTIAVGALFIALAGERFNGGDFVADAAARGAAGLLVSQVPAEPVRAAVILVDDTLAALQALAVGIRDRSATRVVAITGSAGKTTTKEATASLLETRYRVVRSRGNLNNHIGLPLSLLDLRLAPDVAVMELGMNHAGEIRRLVQIARPHVRVWINVGDAHLGHFGSRAALADAKAEILDATDAETLIVANADDPLVIERVRRADCRVLTFGEHPEADVRAIAVTDRGIDGTSADVTIAGAQLRLEVALPGRVHLSNVLAAVAVAHALGVADTALAAAVAALRAPDRRGQIRALPGGGRLVDDSYNASPAAMHVMLDALAATVVSGRRVAVLGEMLELGSAAHALHADCGTAAVRAGVLELITVGGHAADGLAEGALAAGLPARAVHRFATSAAAADAAPALVQPGDLVLVKGSRGTRTDVIADRLLEVA